MLDEGVLIDNCEVSLIHRTKMNVKLFINYVILLIVYCIWPNYQVLCHVDCGSGYPSRRPTIFLFPGEVLSRGCVRNNSGDNAASVFSPS